MQTELGKIRKIVRCDGKVLGDIEREDGSVISYSVEEGYFPKGYLHKNSLISFEISREDNQEVVIGIKRVPKHILKQLSGMKEKISFLEEQYEIKIKELEAQIEKFSSQQQDIHSLENQIGEIKKDLENTLKKEQLENLLLFAIERLGNKSTSGLLQLSQITTEEKTEFPSSLVRLLIGREETREYLKQTLRQAKERVIIVCPWLTYYGLDQIIVNELISCLSRKVKVHLGWCKLEDLIYDKIEGNFWYQALPLLEEISNTYQDDFFLKALGTHAKFFVCDESFAVVGSHNFLTSGISSPELEVGVYTNDKNIVRELAQCFDNFKLDHDLAESYLNGTGRFDAYSPGSINLDRTIVKEQNLSFEVPTIPREALNIPKVVLRRGEITPLQVKTDAQNLIQPPIDIKQEPKTEKFTSNLGAKDNILNSIQNSHIKVESSTSLEEKIASSEVIITLNWNKKKLEGESLPVDLDLCCLYELVEGKKGSIQSIHLPGEKPFLGNLASSPYILLSGDDREGGLGEVITLNSSHLHQLKRVLIFTSIYTGVVKWSEIDGVVKVRYLNIKEYEVPLDGNENNKQICAVALIRNCDSKPEISSEVQYFDSRESMDRAYGWNLNWVPGCKD